MCGREHWDGQGVCTAVAQVGGEGHEEQGDDGICDGSR